jgi:DNA topoisomerase-1
MNTTLSEKDGEQLAKEVHLRYVSDSLPGFTRGKINDGFSYYDEDGKKIIDPKIVERIENLRIPPAWEDVWICTAPTGHLQATGRDEKKRKQYIYHTKWTEIANQTKFDKVLYFSEALPAIRARVTQDMQIPGLKQERILATIVWLLDNTYIRIGNEEYAKDNQHYGLTTLRSKHVDIQGDTAMLEFTGKSGKKHKVGITHPRVIKTIKKLEELPGYELFQFIDDDGVKRPVDSQNVNDYLKDIARENITAKDFRTWGGTVLAGLTLYKIGEYDTKKYLQHNLREAVCTVAKNLGNTPKVCRDYYIHPVVVKTYEEKLLVPHFGKYSSSQIRGLDKAEYATVTLLQKYS